MLCPNQWRTKNPQLVQDLIKEHGKLPLGCNTMLQNAAASGAVNQKQVWERVRGLLSNNQTTDARNLANAIGRLACQLGNLLWQRHCGTRILALFRNQCQCPQIQ